MDRITTLDDVLALARQLTPSDKVRLIERLAPEIERALERKPAAPVRSLRGLWRGIDVTEADTARVRHQMLGQFPREDYRCQCPAFGTAAH
jgi:hypothetical protein